MYYTCCAIVDRHHHCRHVDLKLERKLASQDWAKRINISILSICILDTWLAYSGILGVNTECQNNFYSYLAEELINDIYDETGGISRSEVTSSRRLINDLGTSPLTHNDGSGRYGLSAHMTPTKRTRHDNRGKHLQMIYKKHVLYVDSK